MLCKGPVNPPNSALVDDDFAWVGARKRHRYLVGVHMGRMKYHAGILDALEGREATGQIGDDAA